MRPWAVLSPLDSESLNTPPWDSECQPKHRTRSALTIGSKPFRSTYYDDRMRASPALLRARAPYLIKNTITGFAICSLVIGIYTYTINAISQDEFDDVIVPDEPLQRPAQQSLGTTQALQQAVEARK
ncbi:Nn.00g056790.m01.CDS01 [Neocucurbitaria sp. VM-36]